MGLSEIIEYYKIREDCKKYDRKHNFDMRILDERISKLADKIYLSNIKKFNTPTNFVYDIGFMASELYDMGGHTPCLVNLAESIFSKKKHPLIITRLKTTYQKAPIAMKRLKVCCDIYGEDFHSYKIVNSLINLYNTVVTHPPKVIYMYIHPNDILATALVYLLKKYAGIKFIFHNHASHFPNLAMTMAEYIMDGEESAIEITNQKRHLFNCKKIGLQSRRASEIKYYSDEIISEKKKELGIPKDCLLTVSGGSSYKYFEGNKSPHFEMIKRILEKVPRLYHLAITVLSKEQRNIVNKIFEDSPNEKKRLIFHSLTPNYDILFQCADLFIDSFPISSAMTQIDLMSMKIPTVVKINKQNPEISFEKYMPKDYKYMFNSVSDMENGILELLESKEKRENLAKDNYEFWLDYYESNVAAKRIIKIAQEVINGQKQ